MKDYRFKRVVYNSSMTTARTYIEVPDGEGDVLEIANNLQTAAAGLSLMTDVPMVKIKFKWCHHHIVVYAESCEITHKPTGVEIDVL